MSDILENNPSPVEISPAPPVPGENPPTSAAASPLPPAAALVVNGEVTDERVLAAERRALLAERRAAELERDNEELKKIPTAPVIDLPPAKKPKRWQLSPIIGADDNDD